MKTHRLTAAVRYTDFQVNEISKDGSVVHLRTVGLPASPSGVIMNIIVKDRGRHS